MKPWPLNEPAMNQRSFVCSVVIQDEMDIQVCRNSSLDSIEELAELLCTMPSVDLSDNTSGFHVQSCKQGCRSVSSVVVASAFDLTGPHRKNRLGTVQRLDLRFFINAEDQRFIRRIQIQSDDVANFLDK